MALMANNTSVGANLTTANLLAGLLEEFAHRGRGNRVRVAATSSVTGLNISCLLNDVAVVNDQFISLINRYPQIPEDVCIQELVPVGTRAVVTSRNTTGGAITLFWRVDVKPYG